MRVKSTVGPFMDNQGNLVAGDHDMSEMLNTFFASVFTEEDILFQVLKRCFAEKTVKNYAHFSLLLIWLNPNSAN